MPHMRLVSDMHARLQRYNFHSRGHHTLPAEPSPTTTTFMVCTSSSPILSKLSGGREEVGGGKKQKRKGEEEASKELQGRKAGKEKRGEKGREGGQLSWW